MKAKIYQPSKTAMQSGRGKAKAWILEYEALSPRRPEMLMGWTESSDTLNQVKMNFDTKEDAAAFADKKGMEVTILEPRARKVKPRNYGDNFKYIPHESGKNRLIILALRCAGDLKYVLLDLEALCCRGEKG